MEIARYLRYTIYELYMAPLKKMVMAGGFLFLILVSCGELDSALPVSETYQASAMVGDYSLDEYSGIRREDEIQPFFVNSIKGDQDIRGLVVFFQSPDGKWEGEKIRYALGAEEEEGAIRAAGTDRKLPYFRVAEDLKIGSYKMVFQALGEKGRVFSRIEKPVFYLGGADYSISEISAYLPGYSPDSYLIAPGTLVLLEAGVSAGEGLDPYVLWYDGKKQIGGGRISAGGDRLFFRAPEENGFRLLRVEAFPFPPEENSAPGERARGKIRELSLPVSARGMGPEYAYMAGGSDGSGEERNDFTAYYLFAGDLGDSLDPYSGRRLIRAGDDGPVWLGDGGVYGLAVGPEDSYLIPREIAGAFGQGRGSGMFSFRGKILRDGPFFSASPANGSGSVQLSREKERLVLTLTVEGYSQRVEMALPSTEDFIAFTLGLEFREDAPAASLSAEWAAEGGVSLSLAGLSGGEFIYRLGIPVSAKPAEAEDPGTDALGTDKQEPPGLPVLILDELAVTVREE
jgi:hypothetical protein